MENKITLIRRRRNQEPRYEQMVTGTENKVDFRCLFVSWTFPRPGLRLALLKIFDGMEHWIPDSPLTLLETKRGRSKKEQSESITGVQPTANGLILSPGDALFSATLKKGEAPGSLLKWDFVQKPSSIIRLQDYPSVLTPLYMKKTLESRLSMRLMNYFLLRDLPPTRYLH